MAASPSLPCPVRLGVVRQVGPQAELHRCTLERNVNKMEKLLKKGVDVDCVNDLGQTALFCACLVGLTSAAELLLQYGANPNHRCDDRSTPVHAVVFSCNARLLSTLLDAGGDLRLHDAKGCRPQDWATAGAQPNGPKMLEFLNSCMSQMRSLVQQRLPGETRCTPSSSKMLLRPPSLKDLLKPGETLLLCSRGSDLCLSKKSNSKSNPWNSVQCFGFGQLCVEQRGQTMGLLGCVPLVSDVELTLQEDEPPTVFTLGDYTHMSNFSWRGCRVTVKDVLPQSASAAGRMDSYRDLLQGEQEYCSRLLHPHLLQLLAVALGPDLHTRLVFERVLVGPLHDLIHHKRVELPVLPVEGMLSVLLQVCDALMYLHGRKLVLRSLSSHSVLMVRPTLAKLTCLGFITSVDGSVSSCGPPPPLPAVLINWAAPEVVKEQLCTEKADVYSLCALIQEIYTDALPWGCLCPGEIRHELKEGRALPPHPSLPPLYYTLLQQGLQPHTHQRQLTLQQLRYTLYTDIKEMSDMTWGMNGALSPETKRQQESLNQSRSARRSLDSEIQHELSQLDHMLQREEQGGAEERRSTLRMEREREDKRERSRREREREEIEEERRERIRVEREREERGAQRTRIIHVTDRGRNGGVGEEEEEDEESETEEESTSSSFTERWSERDREEESGGSRGRGAPYGHTLSLDDWKTSTSEVSGAGSEEAGAGPRRERAWPAGGACEAVSSIVLNQQVCRTLLQECQRSLEAAERRTPEPHRTRSPAHRSQGHDEVDHAGRGPGAEQGPEGGGGGAGGGGAVLSGAVGPPPRYSPQARAGPGWDEGGAAATLGGALWLGEFPSSSEASLSTCTEHTHTQAGEFESRMLSRTSNHRRSSTTLCADSEDERPLVARDSASPPRPRWTSEVAEVVSRMACGHLGLCVVPPNSSESDDQEEGPRISHTPSSTQAPPTQTSQQDMKLEKILRSFAGATSESEEDVEFHSVNRTFSLTHDALGGAALSTTSRAEAEQRDHDDLTAEDTLKEAGSDSDGSHSMVDCSSMYHTPGPGTENPTSEEEEEEDLDVTLEVCRPPSVSMDTQTGEPPSAGRRPDEKERQEHVAADQELPHIRCISCNKQISDPSVLGHLPDLAADFAEISSITCSPVLQQKIPPSRRPCYSTPRSPQTSPSHRTLVAPTQPLPSLQNLLETHDHTPSQRESSGSSFVPHSPNDRESSVEETDSSPASQSGFSTADSHAHRSRGVSREESEEEEEGPEEKEEGPDEVGDGSGDGGSGSEHTPSLSPSPSEEEPSCTASLAAFEEEEERMLAEEGERGRGEEEEEEADEEEGRLSDEDFVSVDNSPERDLGMGRNQLAEGMEETDRASSTLDEVLQGMLVERTANQRARSPGPLHHSRAVINMEREVSGEEVGRPGGDTAECYSVSQEVGDPSDGLAKAEDRMEMEVYHGLWSHPHRVIVLEHTPGKVPPKKPREPPA